MNVEDEVIVVLHHAMKIAITETEGSILSTPGVYYHMLIL